MKTIVKKSLLFLVAALLFQGLTAFAQDEGKTKVHLKVKKNDEVTLDTTLYIKSGADSDELKKLLQKYTDTEDMNLHILSSDDLHKHNAFKVMEHGGDSLRTIVVTAGDEADNVDIEIHEKDGQHVMIKKKVSGVEGEKAATYAYIKADNITMSKDIKIRIDTLETLDEKGEKQVRMAIKTDDEGGEHFWVSKSKEGEHHIIMKAGEGGEKVFAIVGGDTTDIKVLHEKGDFIEVIKDADYKKIGKNEKGNYYIVKRASDLEEGEEIVIKKKDGNVVIMEGDEIHDLKGKNVYIKTYDGKEGTIDIFLEKGDDGTVVAKKNIQVIKKKDENGEEVIEVIIEEGDTMKVKKEKKEEKVVKKKK